MSVLPLSYFILYSFVFVFVFLSPAISAFGDLNTNTYLLCFYPCVLIPCGVSFWASFTFPLLANICISFSVSTHLLTCSLRFHLLLPEAPPLSHTILVHTRACTHTCMHNYIFTCIPTCAHMHLHDTPLWPWSLVCRDPYSGLRCCCCLPYQQPVSGRGCSGGKEISRGARTGFLPATENASWEGG